MKIKATTIHKWTWVDEPRVSVRLEIQWVDGKHYTNLGVHQYGKDEWQMLLSICTLGARRAGVDFEHEDLTK